MSIRPVPAIEPTEKSLPPDAALRQPGAPAAHRQTADASPMSGTEPTPEVHDHPAPRPAPDMQQDEVQVQRDSQTNGQIVIKYLDHEGNVILQLPSSQVLGLARAIESALEEQAKSRAGETRSPSEGGRIHGH